MTPEDYGICALVDSLNLIISVFITFQLFSGIGRLIFDYTEEKKKEYFSTILYTSIFIALLFICILHKNGAWIVQTIFPNSNLTYKPYFLMGFISLFFAQIGNISMFMLQINKNGKHIFYGVMIALLIQIIFRIHYVYIEQLGAFGALKTQIIGSFFHMVIFIFFTKNYLVFIFNKRMLKSTILFSWPIIFHALGNYLFKYSDRIILEKYVTISQIGIYSIADRISMVLKVVIDSIQKSIQPDFMESSLEDKDFAKNTLYKEMTIWSVAVFLFLVIIIGFADIVIYALTPSSYHYASVLIPIFCYGYIFRGLYSFASFSLVFEKRMKLIPFITVTSGIINIFLNIILIKKYGLIAAAITTVLANSLTFSFAFFLSNKIYPLRWNWNCLMELFSLSFIIYIVKLNVSYDSIIINIVHSCLATLFFILFIYYRNYNNSNIKILNLFSKLVKKGYKK